MCFQHLYAFFVNGFHLSGKLFACHLGVQVGTFDVEAFYRAARLLHHLFAEGGCLMQLVERRCGQGGEDGRGSMEQVGMGSCTESFLCAFGKVVSAASVYVHAYKAGDDVHSLGINQLGTDEGQVAICHFQYLSVTHQYGTLVQPSPWRNSIRWQSVGIVFSVFRRLVNIK